MILNTLLVTTAHTITTIEGGLIEILEDTTIRIATTQRDKTLSTITEMKKPIIQRMNQRTRTPTKSKSQKSREDSSTKSNSNIKTHSQY